MVVDPTTFYNFRRVSYSKLVGGLCFCDCGTMAIILIVEDRPTDRKLLATVLRSSGHEVVETSDGDEALRTLTGTPAQLVISDILMPTIEAANWCAVCVNNRRSHRPRSSFMRPPTTNAKRGRSRNSAEWWTS